MLPGAKLLPDRAHGQHLQRLLQGHQLSEPLLILQRLELRLWPDSGAWVAAHVSYDEGRTWQYAGILRGGSRQVQAGLMAVRPVRCSQLRLRLSGHGGCRIYSISAVYEKGSDLP